MMGESVVIIFVRSLLSHTIFKLPTQASIAIDATLGCAANCWLIFSLSQTCRVAVSLHHPETALFVLI